MMDMTDYRQQIVTVQGWGWYISLLGSDALDDRHFVNKMLKVPERTFVHFDPQIQVATLVSKLNFYIVLKIIIDGSYFYCPLVISWAYRLLGNL